MNDLFEDQLRADLHTAAGQPAYDSIDPTTVIGEGRRVVRRRQRLQAIGAAAAVAVIGVGGFLATDTGRTTTAPPAHHSSTVPVSRALLEVGDVRGRILVERSPGSQSVRVLEAASGNELNTLRVPAGAEHLSYATVDPEPVLVGLLPRGSHLLQVGTNAVGPGSAYRSDAQPLGDDLTVFAVRFDQPDQLLELSRILWSDADGTVWDTNTPLPSARFDSPGNAAVPQLVWVDAANNTWGTSDPVGGALSEKPLEDWSLNSMGSFAPAGSQNAGEGTFVVTGLLPSVDVSKLSATWAQGVTVVSPVQGQQLTNGNGHGLTAFHAVVTTGGKLPEPLLRSITFTGADGKEHTHSYPMDSIR